MAAKVVQISVDSGSNWLTLPGNSGTFQETAASVEDTVYGQEFKSQMSNILSWKVDANALYKGIAGYIATIKKGGTPTTLTDEATTLVSGKTYRITDVTKRVLDNGTAVTVEDGGTDKTAEVLSIDYLMGTVTFKGTYTVTGAVTVTGKYVPLTTLGKAKTWDLKQTAETIDTTDLATAAANGGYSTFIPGLRTVTLSLKGFYDVASGLRALIAARTVVVIEINPDGSGNSLCRGFFVASGEQQSGNVGALEEESTDFTLNVPSSDYVPFNWFHDTDTTLHASLTSMLTAWLAGTAIDVKYLYDGTNGISGDAVITDISLAGGISAMNSFTANFQGSGAPTTVGTG